MVQWVICICVFFFSFAWRSTIFRYNKNEQHFLLHSSSKYESLSGCEAHSSVVFRYYFLHFFTLNLRSLSFCRSMAYISVHNAIEFSLVRPTKLVAHSCFRYLCFSFDIFYYPSFSTVLSFFRCRFSRSFAVYFTFALKYQQIMISWHYKWIFFRHCLLILINCFIWKEFIKNVQVIYHNANRTEDEYPVTPSLSLSLSVASYKCITNSFPLNANVCVRICVLCCSHNFSNSNRINFNYFNEQKQSYNEIKKKRPQTKTVASITNLLHENETFVLCIRMPAAYYAFCRLFIDTRSHRVWQ